MKSPRNKTIDIPLSEGQHLLDRCLHETDALNDVTDRVICGDSLSLMPLLPRGLVDLAVVDPPYNLTKDFHGEKFSEMARQEYIDYTERWILLLKPLLKPNASIYVCCDYRSSGIIGEVLERHFIVRNRITWQREKGRGASKNWKNSMEDIWFATVGDDYHFDLDAVKIRRRVVAPYRCDGVPKDWEETDSGNYRNTCPSNFWDDITIPFWSMPENTAHPTQKPEKLLAKLILASSREGDVVFDPFLGSGTTAVTAKKLGRHFCGIEQNELYCVWAQKRLENAENDKAIQGYENGIFYERNSQL